MFRNSGVWCAGVGIAALLAFWPSYLSKPFAPVDAYTHVHAITLAIWCVLLVVQPLLIRYGNKPLHRALGKVSLVVAPTIFIVTLLLVHQRMGALPAADFAGAADFFYLPLSFIVLFAACVAFAIRYRRRQTLHAAFMLATPLTFIDPVLSRIIAFYIPTIDGDWYPIITFATADALLAIIAYKARGPVLWLVAAFGVVELGWFTFAKSDSWLAFAGWFRDLPLT
ncbi:MAG: hypothetical protein ACKV2T_10840 [Kofleriaceae bacterium]